MISHTTNRPHITCISYHPHHTLLYSLPRHVPCSAKRPQPHLGVPWVVTVHATEHGRHQGWVDKHPQSHIHGVERRMVHRADRVIACSRYMRGHIASVFELPASRVTVIPHGIDPEGLHVPEDLA